MSHVSYMIKLDWLRRVDNYGNSLVVGISEMGVGDGSLSNKLDAISAE